MPSRSTCTGCAGSSRRPAWRSSRCAAWGIASRKTGPRLKLALFADIHSNLEAITACLAHARCAGGGPLRVSRRSRRLRRRPGGGARADRAARGERRRRRARQPRRGGDGPSGRRAQPQRAGRRRLDARAARPTAARVPRVAAADRRGRQPPVRPRERGRAGAVDLRQRPARGGGEHRAPASASYIFSGHVHEQKLYYTGASGKPMPFRPVPGTPIPAAKHHRWLAIVGSAGQPRDGNNAACYALFDTRAGAADVLSRSLRPSRPRSARSAPPDFPIGSRCGWSAERDERRRRPGSVIDGFRLGEMIHAGSMATIFRLDRCRRSAAAHHEDPAARTRRAGGQRHRLRGLPHGAGRAGAGSAIIRRSSPTATSKPRRIS